MSLKKGLLIGALTTLGAVTATAAIVASRNQMDEEDEDDQPEIKETATKTVLVTGRECSGKTKLIDFLKGSPAESFMFTTPTSILSEDRILTKFIYNEFLLTKESLANNCATIKSILGNAPSLIYCLPFESNNDDDISNINTLASNGIKVIVLLTKCGLISFDENTTFEQKVSASFSGNDKVTIINEREHNRMNILKTLV